jgi:hypothetical protein
MLLADHIEKGAKVRNRWKNNSLLFVRSQSILLLYTFAQHHIAKWLRLDSMRTEWQNVVHVRTPKLRRLSVILADIFNEIMPGFNKRLT